MDERFLATYRRASQVGDIDTLTTTLAPDVELVSPVSRHMVFRGRDDVRVVLTAVYRSLRGWGWHAVTGEGGERVLAGEGRVGPWRLEDTMAVDLAEDGRIRRLRPSLRPVLGAGLFTAVLTARLGRHPGVVWRAVRT